MERLATNAYDCNVELYYSNKYNIQKFNFIEHVANLQIHSQNQRKLRTCTISIGAINMMKFKYLTLSSHT
jgi:hypothetical protein